MEVGAGFVVFLVALLLGGIWLRYKKVSWAPSSFVLLLFTIWTALTALLVRMGDWVFRN